MALNKPARICACRFRIKAGDLCPCEKQRKAEADAGRDSAAARGYDAAWRKLRAEHLKRQPNCVVCGKPGDTVDHIKRVRDFPELRLDPRNLQTMCAHHHSSTAQRQERGKAGKRAFKPARPGGGSKLSADALGPERGPAHDIFPDRKAKTEVAL